METHKNQDVISASTSFQHQRSHFQLSSFLVPLCAGMIFLIFSVINLQLPVWFDESYSAYLTRGSFADIWHLTSLDVHPPLYYFLLKIWGTLFGSTDFALRFMSVFFGIIAIVFAFQLFKRWFGVRIASFATLAMAFSPVFLRYGQEMRMYTLVFAIVIVATYILTLAVDTNRRRYWLLYGFLLALGMWTHYFTALAWLAHLCYLIYHYRKHFWQKNIIFAYAFALVLFIPWFPCFLHQMIDVEGGFWIKAISLATPIDFLANSLAFYSASSAESWIAILIITATILLGYFTIKLYRHSPATERKYWRILLFILCIPPVLLFLFSLPPLRSLFVDRYVAYSAILLWALLGIILAQVFSKNYQQLLSAKLTKLYSSAKASRRQRFSLQLPRLLFSIAMIACAVIGVVQVETRQPDGSVKDIVLIADALASSNVPILASNYAIYYDSILYSTEQHPVYGVDAWNTYQWGSLEPIRQIGYNLITDLDDFTAKHQRFWLIVDNNKEGRELPDGLANYRINSEASTEKHLALELVSDTGEDLISSI